MVALPSQLVLINSMAVQVVEPDESKIKVFAPFITSLLFAEPFATI
jgi:hypothetical protein